MQLLPCPSSSDGPRDRRRPRLQSSVRDVFTLRQFVKAGSVWTKHPETHPEIWMDSRHLTQWSCEHMSRHVCPFPHVLTLTLFYRSDVPRPAAAHSRLQNHNLLPNEMLMILPQVFNCKNKPDDQIKPSPLKHRLLWWNKTWTEGEE